MRNFVLKNAQWGINIAGKSILSKTTYFSTKFKFFGEGLDIVGPVKKMVGGFVETVEVLVEVLVIRLNVINFDSNFIT